MSFSFSKFFYLMPRPGWSNFLIFTSLQKSEYFQVFYRFSWGKNIAWYFVLNCFRYLCSNFNPPKIAHWGEFVVNHKTIRLNIGSITKTIGWFYIASKSELIFETFVKEENKMNGINYQLLWLVADLGCCILSMKSGNILTLGYYSKTCKIKALVRGAT